MPHRFLKGVRVLVVEDEQLLAAELVDRLGRCGATVVDAVDTGADAIAAAETGRPELVLMDVRLKGPIDGIEAAVLIEERIGAAVVFLSAHSDDVTLTRARHAGASAYLVKPVGERELLAALATALDRHALLNRARALNQRLLEQTRQLAAKNRELDEFASVVSHDLRAPLRNIRMLLDLLGSDEPLGADNQEIVQRARNNGRRMATLIDSLLELARAGSGAMAWADVDLARVARDVASDLRANLHEAGVALTLPGQGAAVRGDATLLRQLLQNLVSNAIKFRRTEGTPTIAIEVESCSGQVQIAVRDNGIGFAAEDAVRIFERFVRLGAAPEREGAGIGLATCVRIVERHGGSMRAEGTPGAGATFVVTLPTAAQAVAESATSS